MKTGSLAFAAAGLVEVFAPGTDKPHFCVFDLLCECQYHDIDDMFDDDVKGAIELPPTPGWYRVWVTGEIESRERETQDGPEYDIAIQVLKEDIYLASERDLEYIAWLAAERPA